ncbi:hypothetical protein KY342_00625, partial [Candidatus Woesearchaeota archaeon]|nr:hypothetical protein [Candidatus Woesearchaeota archaeon]
KMFFFGMDIPLVELLVAIGLITLIILFESILLLYLILHHRKDIKLLKHEIRKMSELISKKER